MGMAPMPADPGTGAFVHRVRAELMDPISTAPEEKVARGQLVHTGTSAACFRVIKKVLFKKWISFLSSVFSSSAFPSHVCSA